ncbi:uncharacterized protein LAESUDRAFT_732376 [Laetiporus sulphureus 93-53]|uniref:Uncharacterized protein n=1 Tax=Laetiporus sulphureus 93-53 TaxID=1314785 RepID=A0A165B6J2_9APHY|nr:uncharacterized protein LAESUDRAFT_732376 [Laetiporus sulphureus 93-53]KZT00354.1 hypothetical protein LAESUDRAFT_732376 [Laetiporus sulphureus 93-53]
MNITNAFLSPSLPPTTNHLDPRERARLMRSARKLGNVLGSTPQLLESEPAAATPIARLPIGPSPGRSGSIKSVSSFRQGSICSRASTPSLYSSSSTNSSVVSLALPPPHASCESLPEPRLYSTKHKKARKSKELPRPLVLRLNAVPLPPSDRRLPGLPPTPSTAVPTTPISPTTPVAPSPEETRRKRMAKLKRTLGENIPLDLVFPRHTRTSSSSPPRSPNRAGRHRNMSVDLGREAPQPSRSSRVWVTGTDKWVGEWNRKDIFEVQQQLRTLKGR